MVDRKIFIDGSDMIDKITFERLSSACRNGELRNATWMDQLLHLRNGYYDSIAYTEQYARRIITTLMEDSAYNIRQLEALERTSPRDCTIVVRITDVPEYISTQKDVPVVALSYMQLIYQSMQLPVPILITCQKDDLILVRNDMWTMTCPVNVYLERCLDEGMEPRIWQKP